MALALTMLALPAIAAAQAASATPPKPVTAPAKAVPGVVGGQQNVSRDPIDIKSDRLEAHNKERKIIFIGNVQARQRDTLIFADRLVAYYEKEGKDVERIVALGNVKITQDEKIATSREAVFENRSRKIVLTGDPHLWQGKDELRGEMITVFMDEDRVLVERASGTFSPARLQEAEVSN
jgi:lipopolysaccharide export system protein LptA